MANSEIARKLISTVISFLIVGGTLALILQWHQQQMRQKAGALLIALSRSRTRLLVSAVSGFIVAILLALAVQFLFLEKVDSYFAWTLGLNIGGVTILLGIFASTELREKGILLSLVLLPWSQIQSYQWTEGNGQILLLNLKQPLDLDFRKQLRIRINPRVQPDVDRIFHLKLNHFN